MPDMSSNQETTTNAISPAKGTMAQNINKYIKEGTFPDRATNPIHAEYFWRYNMPPTQGSKDMDAAATAAAATAAAATAAALCAAKTMIDMSQTHPTTTATTATTTTTTKTLPFIAAPRSSPRLDDKKRKRAASSGNHHTRSAPPAAAPPLRL